MDEDTETVDEPTEDASPTVPENKVNYVPDLPAKELYTERRPEPIRTEKLSVSAIADQVESGAFGPDGAERNRKLRQAGHSPAMIRGELNRRRYQT